MSKADDIFWREFGVILVTLTVFTVVVFFIARSIGGDALETAQNSTAAVASRIEPVAKVRVGDPSKAVEAPKPAAQAPAAAPSAAASAGGESVYNGACVACHAAGVAGAPKFGDAASWKDRLGLGEDAMVASVVNGKGAMPPKGGNPALTEDQIRAAVQHMLAAVSAGSASSDAAPAQAKAEAPKEEAPKAEATQPAAASESVATATATAGAGKPGGEVYNGVCVACHVAGVANAPKLTDKENWTTRAAGGFPAMVGSVVNGKGAMPPKGGNPSLQQADVENAVRYMLEQAGVSAAGS